MSSGISTERVRLKADTTGRVADTTPDTDVRDVRRVRLQAGQSLQPWQFFVLAALGCATAATFMARGQGITAVILLTLLMGTAAVIGLAMLRALNPLVS